MYCRNEKPDKKIHNILGIKSWIFSFDVFIFRPTTVNVFHKLFFCKIRRPKFLKFSGNLHFPLFIKCRFALIAKFIGEAMRRSHPFSHSIKKKHIYRCLNRSHYKRSKGADLKFYVHNVHTSVNNPCV